MTRESTKNGRRQGIACWLLPAALALATLLLVGAILYFLQDHYRSSSIPQNRLIVCGSTEHLGQNAGILAGCRAVPCIEVLPSGEMATVYYAYC